MVPQSVFHRFDQGGQIDFKSWSQMFVNPTLYFNLCAETSYRAATEIPMISTNKQLHRSPLNG